MNEWNKVWNNRDNHIEISDNIFEMYCELKKADGFDTQNVPGYYESFYHQWQKMKDKILKGCGGKIESVYEVGCGSGVNLYLFQRLFSQLRIGGIDYSVPLVKLAKNVVKSDDIYSGEALGLNSDNQYDVVLSDSVFQYFQNAEYGMTVLDKMYDKANKMVVITEIHDIDLYDEHMQYRKSCVENYDEKYKGLDKTFYDKQGFVDFAKKKQCKYEIVKPDNEIYWNNKYVFDFYLYKN